MDEAYDQLRSLYGLKQTKEIIKEITSFLEFLEPFQSFETNPLWYKHLNMYVTYPDSFYAGKLSYIERLEKQLPYIQKLGCNAVHILPFLDSPMVDKGFDIKDFTRMRSDLGSMDSLNSLLEKAHILKLHLFMDLVFNHVSDQHEWFQKAESGDEYFRDFFIWTKDRPNFLRKIHKDAAVWAEFDINGKKELVNIAFPEYSGEIPNWRQGKDGIWYYHTYYPEQLDVNWHNSHVFTEMVKIMLFWASWGFNFRMDAIPFIGKAAYKKVDDDNERTFLITAALSSIAKEINPACTFLVETYEQIETVMAYFGDSNVPQAHLAYNFHQCTNIWVSLITKESSYIWKMLDKTKIIPKHGEWINFLRNHDELSLAYLNDDLKERISEELLENGAPFREGYGISGRTFSFLNKNIKRHAMAYFLLVSLPGGTSIPYGDEIGATNIPLENIPERNRKDTRNINRGTLTQEQMHDNKSRRMYKRIQKILEYKKVLRDYINIWPDKIRLETDDTSILAFEYILGISKLSVFINLSGDTKKLKSITDRGTPVASVNRVTLKDTHLELGPYAGVWLQK